MARREYTRSEEGFKQKVQVKLDGLLIERDFRNKGEAIQYLQKTEELNKQDIKRRVTFLFS